MPAQYCAIRKAASNGRMWPREGWVKNHNLFIRSLDSCLLSVDWAPSNVGAKELQTGQQPASVPTWCLGFPSNETQSRAGQGWGGRRSPQQGAERRSRREGTEAGRKMAAIGGPAGAGVAAKDPLQSLAT